MVTMSLTRAQWQELWDSLKRLEGIIHRSMPRTGLPKGAALREIQLQKDLIQSVIGQME